MSVATPIDDALTGLSELAACDLGLAKRFCRRIEACPEDPEGDERSIALARTYQRMARSYRQSVVVQARLRRELKAEARDDADHDHDARVRDVIDLQSAIVARVRPLIWAEHEVERAEEVDDLLDELVRSAAARDNFLDASADTHAAAFAAVLGLGEDAPETPDPSPASPSGGKRREAAQQRIADGGSESDADAGAPPPETPPEPDPAPRPPDLMPWERNPHARYPGGSGW